jgi:gliding motility-associated-like protein
MVNDRTKKGSIPVRKTVLIMLLGTGFLTTGFTQSCNGVLGEAIINETFGSSVVTPLETGKTTYQFVSDRCPGDGDYILANSTHCYGSTWHTVAEDHTPDDDNGVMAIVNASYEAGEFYSQPVPGLCQGITYEFSVWVLNLMNPIRANGCNPIEVVPLDPNITMKIERANGSSIQVINTGAIGRSTTPTWIRYSILFTMPMDGNTVVVKLINNGPGGCGNDLALDDIQFRPCHPLLRITHSGNASSNLEVCANTTQLVTSSLGPGYDKPVYQWQESRDSLRWEAIPNATDSTFLIPVIDTNKRFYRLVCTQIPNTITDQNTQCKTVSNALSITPIQASECQAANIFVPDSFTPNQDGINDVLVIYHEDNVSFELQIFNRWGSVIFKTDTNGFRWDGMYLEKPCLEGVYPWKITYQAVDPNQKTSAYIKTGQVMLLR